MAEEPYNISRYTSLDDIVKLYMIQVGAVNNARYNQYMTMAQLAYQELEFDVLKKFTYRYLPVDSSTKTVAIPDDMLQYTMIGFVNQVGEIIELTYDPKLVFRQEVLSPVCHCDECGCTDEVCSTISNVVLSETVVTIPTPVVQCDYSVTLLFGQREGLCSSPIFPFTFISVTIDGFTSAVTTVVNNNGEYAAVIDALSVSDILLPMTIRGTNSGGGSFVCATTISYYTDYPMTIVSYVKNSVTVLDGTVVANYSELSAYMATLGWTGITESGCVNATNSVTLPLQKCTYSTGGFPFTFNNFSITLGGAFQFITGSYTTVDQIVNVLNALVTGAGYFYKISSSTFGAIINSATANYFGNLNATAPTGYTTNTNTSRWDISGFTFPLSSASVIIDGVTYTNNVAMADSTALVVWLNTLTTTAQGIFTLLSPTLIKIAHYEQAKDIVATYPTTSVSATINGVVYTSNTPMANVSAVLNWLNTLGVGAFGIYINGGEPITIYYLGLQNWTLFSATWGGGSAGGSVTTNGGSCAFNLITDLEGCFDIPTYEFVISNSNDTWSDFIIESQSVSAQQVVVLNSSCSTVTVDETYTNYCRTCTDSQGNITKECCNYGGQFINECDYEIQLDASKSGGFGFPLTDGIININGTDTTIATMNGINDLVDYLEGLGFYITSTSPLVFKKNLSATAYGTISSVIQGVTQTFTSSNCLTMEIAKSCNTETICNVPVKECGCVTLTDKEINTLYNCNLINNTMYERWIHGGDISTTYLQPYNLYGFYNVDMHKGVIQLDPFFKYDTIYLEYYGSSEVSTKNFAVPLLAREFILSYIHKMANLRKGNVPRGELEYIKKECRAAKHNLRIRWQPPREKQIIDLIKTPPAKG